MNATGSVCDNEIMKINIVELNSHISFLNDMMMYQRTFEEKCDQLENLQHILYDIITSLSFDPQYEEPFNLFLTKETELLQEKINKLEKLLPHLQYTILPGGGRIASYAFVVYSICRRVSFPAVSSSSSTIATFLDRLTEYFFLLARWLSLCEERRYVSWINRK